MATKPTVVNSSNVGSWFTVSDSDGISSWNGNTLTVKGVYSNNRVKLTALCDMIISFDYTTTEFCKISLKGQYICDTGEDGSYSGTLSAGQSFHCYFSSTGSTQTCTYSNITCTKLEKKKFYVGFENFAHRTLPNGYEQLEYIESSGTQYIDTGFKPKQNTRVIANCTFPLTSATEWLFGVRVASGDSMFGFLKYQSKFRFDFGNSNNYFSATSDLVTVDMNGRSVTVNGTETVSATSQTFTSAYNLVLFANNTKGSVSGFAKAQMFACKIYDNGTLVRDFVPCKNSSGVVGLYDVVNGVFYNDSAGGAFIAGSSYCDVAHEIKKVYVGVDNVARNVRKGYVSVNNAARLFFQYGKTLGEYTEGDIVYLNENGTPTAFYVACHNYNSDLNGTGRTLLVRKDIHSNMVWAGTTYKTTTEYDVSTIDSWCNTTYFNLFDSNVQGAIGTTKFLIASDGSLEAELMTLERSVFLLAMRELGFTGSGYATSLVDGTTLPTAEILRLAKLNGTGAMWWTRSPRNVTGAGSSAEDYEDSSYYNKNIWFINASGNGVNNTDRNDSRGARPAFTLSSNVLFNAATNEFLGV